MTTIQFARLQLRNFKSHKALSVNFAPILRITGTNGAGKSTIGEAITWVLYGVDPLGNTLTKQLSPEPLTYEYDRVEAHLELSVDGKPILLSRYIEKGTMKYAINETPKQATAFKELTESLFDKSLFLSLFSPGYFFSQKWEDQRAQLLRYVTAPAQKEVLTELPKPQADKLAELLKKKNLDDLKATHADNKNRQDKALIAAKERVRTLKEQLAEAPEEASGDQAQYEAELAEIDAKLAASDERRRQAGEVNRKIARLQSEREGYKARANDAAAHFKELKESPVEDTCDKCGQALDEHTRQAVLEHKERELSTVKGRYNELKGKFAEIGQQLAELTVIDIDPSEDQGLIRRRSAIAAAMNAAGSRDRQAGQLQQAEEHEKTTHESYQESVFILDAIKAFSAKEAEMMAEKVSGLFTTLKPQLFQTNKGDGEQKPFFELEQNGKPFRKLSRGEQAVAGLELIDVLSQQSGVICPVFLDNAESIVRYKQPAGQLIECRVVGAHNEIQITEVQV